MNGTGESQTRFESIPPAPTTSNNSDGTNLINIFTRKGSLLKLVCYIVFLFVVWIIRIDLFPLLDEQAPTDFAQFYISNYLRLLLWVVPLFVLYLNNIGDWLKAFGFRPLRLIDGLSVSLLLGELILALFLDVRFQPVAITDDVWIKVGSIIVISPLVEELVFRGYIFPEISSFSGQIWGAIISSLLFAFIHLPIWLHNQYPMSEIITSSLVAFIFGLAMCAVTRYTKSLYPAFAIHGLNNLIVLFLLNPTI
jgi:hypothetical protein